MSEDFISNIRVTNRINWDDWRTIQSGPLFLEFLRNRITFDEDYKVTNENGDPAFWAVIDWIEQNSQNVWYQDGDSLYFYSDDDAMAFKLRWS